MGSAILLRSSAFQWCVIHNQKVNSKRHTMVLVKAVPSLLYGFLLYEKIANFSNRPYLESGNCRLMDILITPISFGLHDSYFTHRLRYVDVWDFGEKISHISLLVSCVRISLYARTIFEKNKKWHRRSKTKNM